MKSLQIFRKVETSYETLKNEIFCGNFDFYSPHTTIFSGIIDIFKKYKSFSKKQFNLMNRIHKLSIVKRNNINNSRLKYTQKST